MSQQAILTLGQIARRFPGVQTWMVGRLFERGILPQPKRVGILRVVTEDQLPVIEAALRKANYLPTAEEVPT